MAARVKKGIVCHVNPRGNHKRSIHAPKTIASHDRYRNARSMTTATGTHGGKKSAEIKPADASTMRILLMWDDIYESERRKISRQLYE